MKKAPLSYRASEKTTTLYSFASSVPIISQGYERPGIHPWAKQMKMQGTQGARNSCSRETTNRLDHVGLSEFSSVVILTEATTVPLCPDRREH